jgi:MGT family glycosyltransferase
LRDFLVQIFTIGVLRSKGLTMKALFFGIPASGHLNPSLPLVAELVRRGVKVVYLNTERYRTVIEATGATFKPYALVRDDYFDARGLDGSNPPLAAATMIATCQEFLPELLDTVRAEQPDVLLYDSMCPWGALVGRVVKLPTVTSLALWIMSPSALISTTGVRVVVRALIEGMPHIRRFNAVSKQIGRQYGIKALGFNECFNAPADLTISYTSAQIQPGGERMDSRFQFVGTTIFDRKDAPAFPLDQLEGKPVIYVSLGTLINSNVAFFKNCMTAFANMPYTVVMAIGSRLSIDQLGTIPPNFIIRPYVPQVEILKRAVLFISHAGMNSVHDALYLGVPLLLVPQQSEQMFTAARITGFGAGLRLDSAQTTPDALRQSAERILGDASFKRQAEALGKTLREAGGAGRAADLVLGLVNKT